ncbi:MAG: PorV/PorQ family protein [Elusimicrobia bacterium]|nr:PorV/PorQ family protein [Elusimicrobiota bacterium]
MRPAILFLILGLSPQASSEETAAFLKLQSGARSIGLAEAFTAVADDLNAQALNPGGLAQLKAREAGFSHAELFAETKLDSLGYAHPLPGSRGTLAAGLLRLSHGSVVSRDASGKVTGSFEASDTALQAGWAGGLSGIGMIGLNVKYIESRLAYATARGVAFDLGLLRLGKGAWSWGAAVQNLGSGLRYAERRESLPLAVAAGAAVRLGGGLLLAGELRARPKTGGISAGIGTEYGVLPNFTVRGGYRSAMDRSSIGGSAAPISGLGLGFGIRVRKAAIDYAITPQGELGQAQRLSVSTRF